MVTGLSVLRCPACGQQLESSADRCPLCEIQLGDDPITGDDVTPYARAHAQGRRGWSGMVAWVWSAGAGRLKHLALMRSSAASRRFARVNVLLFALGVALSQLSVVGWKWVYPQTHSDGAEASANPTGAGWFQVASIPRSMTLERGADVPSDLWWNPAQSLIAVPLAGVLALFMVWWVGMLTRTGAAWFHRRPYRKQQRLAAAIQYSAAWVVPFLAAFVVLAFRPIAYVGTVARWRWCPSDHAFLILAAILGGLGVTLWWFWLVRLGATAPAATRARVIAFLALGVPVLAVAGASAWWYGKEHALAPIFDLLGLRFS